MLNWFQRQKNIAPTTVDANQLSKELLASLMVMAWFVEAKDPYTGGHLWRVSRYANLLAQAGGLPEVDIARITLGAFLHDLGKVAVPDAILGKTTKLTVEEFAVIKTHPEAGGRLLAGHPLGHLVLPAVELHHERPDGKGYPYGLTAGMIPTDAAIVGICDAFDAMTSLRPYRKPLPLAKVIAILVEGSGSQFNPFWVGRFIELVEQDHFANVMGHIDDGIPLHTCPHCGPTVLQQQHQHAGDLLACGLCHSEMQLVEKHGQLTVTATGKKAAAHLLQPQADNRLIKAVIEASLAQIPISQLVRFTAHA